MLLNLSFLSIFIGWKEISSFIWTDNSFSRVISQPLNHPHRWPTLMKSLKWIPSNSKHSMTSVCTIPHSLSSPSPPSFLPLCPYFFYFHCVSFLMGSFSVRTRNRRETIMLDDKVENLEEMPSNIPSIARFAGFFPFANFFFSIQRTNWILFPQYLGPTSWPILFSGSSSTCHALLLSRSLSLCRLCLCHYSLEVCSGERSWQENLKFLMLRMTSGACFLTLM